METFLWEVANAAGYHPGPVTPSTTGGAPLGSLEGYYTCPIILLILKICLRCGGEASFSSNQPRVTWFGSDLAWQLPQKSAFAETLEVCCLGGLTPTCSALFSLIWWVMDDYANLKSSLSLALLVWKLNSWLISNLATSNWLKSYRQLANL